MKPTIAFILPLLLLTTKAFSQFNDRVKIKQSHFYINDEIENNNLFSVVDSKMIDTSSVSFKTAKSNVLDYCNKHLSFHLDSVAIYYSCREYKEVNPHTTEKVREWMKELHLKNEFFITFRVNPTTDYHLHFYLDSLMEVRDASEQLFKIKQERIWNILPWSSISEDVFEKEKNYILPLGEINLEYDTKYKRFVYVLIQAKTDQTPIRYTSEYSGNYDLNKIIVDAENGNVLKEMEAHYGYMANPSW